MKQRQFSFSRLFTGILAASFLLLLMPSCTQATTSKDDGSKDATETTFSDQEWYPQLVDYAPLDAQSIHLSRSKEPTLGKIGMMLIRNRDFLVVGVYQASNDGKLTDTMIIYRLYSDGRFLVVDHSLNRQPDEEIVATFSSLTFKAFSQVGFETVPYSQLESLFTEPTQLNKLEELLEI